MTLPIERMGERNANSYFGLMAQTGNDRAA
jgi:hypothetical protein